MSPLLPSATRCDEDIDEINKRAAAKAAVDQFVDPTTKVVGIGGGSQCRHVVPALGEKIAKDGLNIRVMTTTSMVRRLVEIEQKKLLAVKPKVGSLDWLSELDQDDHIDVSFVSVDEVRIPTSLPQSVLYTIGIHLCFWLNNCCLDLSCFKIDSSYNAIIGKSGTLSRDKIIQANSDLTVFLIDETKYRDRIGSKALPIEISPFCYAQTLKQIGSLPSFINHVRCDLRVGSLDNQSLDGHEPAITADGSLIADCYFDEPLSADRVEQMADELKTIPAIHPGLAVGAKDYRGELVVVVVTRTHGTQIVKKTEGEMLRPLLISPKPSVESQSNKNRRP